jgi:hypothetical protein
MLMHESDLPPHLRGQAVKLHWRAFERKALQLRRFQTSEYAQQRALARSVFTG